MDPATAAPAALGVPRPATLTLPPFITREMWFAWLLRPELRFGGPQDPGAMRQFAVWWLYYGQREYPLHWRADPELVAAAWEMLEADFAGNKVQISRFLAVMLRGRTDVLEAAAVQPAYIAGRLWAWFLHYDADHAGARAVLGAPQARALAEPDPAIVQDALLPITRVMHWIWQWRADLQSRCPLDDAEGRLCLAAWIVLIGLDAVPAIVPFVAPSFARLTEPAGEAYGGASVLAALVAAHAPDAALRFARGTPDGRSQFEKWIRTEGAAQFPGLQRVPGI